MLACRLTEASGCHLGPSLRIRCARRTPAWRWPRSRRQALGLGGSHPTATSSSAPHHPYSLREPLPAAAPRECLRSGPGTTSSCPGSRLRFGVSRRLPRDGLPEPLTAGAVTHAAWNACNSCTGSRRSTWEGRLSASSSRPSPGCSSFTTTLPIAEPSAIIRQEIEERAGAALELTRAAQQESWELLNWLRLEYGVETPVSAWRPSPRCRAMTSPRRCASAGPRARRASPRRPSPGSPTPTAGTPRTPSRVQGRCGHMSGGLRTWCSRLTSSPSPNRTCCGARRRHGCQGGRHCQGSAGATDARHQPRQPSSLRKPVAKPTSNRVRPRSLRISPWLPSRSPC